MKRTAYVSGKACSPVPRDDDLDFRVLARKFELSGGKIGNVVLAAAYLAADEGEPIAMKHLKDEKEFEGL